MEFQKQNTFKSPPKEWMKYRLEKLHETLSKNTTASALVLRKLLGPILLEPVSEPSVNYEIATLLPVARNDNGKGFKPYYVAHTKIQTLALLDDKYKGSNRLYWRRGWDSNPRYRLLSAQSLSRRPCSTTPAPLHLLEYVSLILSFFPLFSNHHVAKISIFIL